MGGRICLKKMFPKALLSILDHLNTKKTKKRSVPLALKAGVVHAQSISPHMKQNEVNNNYCVL